MSSTKSLVPPMVRKTKCISSGLIKIIAILLLISTAACGQAATIPTATAMSTMTPMPTLTPAPTATPAPTLQPGDSQRTLTVDSLERSYLLHIPPGLDSQQPVPVVFVFPGVGEDGVNIQSMSGFNDVADINSFMVVYPNGFQRSWNALGCCGDAVRNKIDDLAFVRHMLVDLATIAPLDPKRIYAAGFSNGGMFSYRLACEMSDTFAAIAPVDSPMPANPCQPEQPVSIVTVYFLVGEDTANNVPSYFSGTDTDIVIPPLSQTMATWVQLDGCGEAAQVDKQGIITHTAYADCRSGTAVELYLIEAEGHAWPSPYAYPTASSQMMWAFFKVHPKP